MDTIKVIDRFTAETWERKIGAGPWKPVDLTPYAGRPPIFNVSVNFMGDVLGVETMVMETTLTREEAILRGWAEPE